MESQSKRILNRLLKGCKVTSLDGFTCFSPPITRIAARISDLRNKGHNISDMWYYPEDKKKAYKVYYITNVNREVTKQAQGL